MKKVVLLISILLVSFNLNAQCWNSIYESGYGYNCFKIRNDGTLWANGDGMYINGNTTDPNNIITSPNQVGTANNWKSVSNGVYHIAAVKTDGTLWAWGANSFGQLGNGNNNNTTPSNYIPAQIGTASNWKTVSAGSNFNIAIKTDGTLWAWGLNGIGNLGDGTTINTYSPIQIGTANKRSLSNRLLCYVGLFQSLLQASIPQTT